jgi:hypothetical protein
MLNIYSHHFNLEGNKLKYLNVLQRLGETAGCSLMSSMIQKVTGKVFLFINLVTLVYVDALQAATNCIAQNIAQMTFLVPWVMAHG